MLGIKKLTTAAATKTHGEEDASAFDIANPTVPLADSLGNVVRAGLYALGGWVGRGKRDTGSWSL